ncbi:hypothetical protein SEA_PERIWINKLE_86 [Gordonia phage Periwinkle]|nr:hypothetical protein SEA_PERIWINKLE_86 [Gordonia phage Periwinkle]
MPSDTPTPAEIAATHSVVDDQTNWPEQGKEWVLCRCGDQFGGHIGDGRGYDQHGDHLIAALSEHYHLLPKASGQVVVSPAEYSVDPHTLTVKWADEQVLVAKGKGVVRLYVEDHRYTPDDARELGAALLAAADVAEEPK